VERRLTHRRPLLGAWRWSRLALAAIVVPLSLAALGPSPALADDDPSTFSKADERLHPAQPAKGDQFSHRWQGDLPVQGNLVVRFDRSVHLEPKNASDLIEVTFTPDDASISMLPQATGSYARKIEDLYVSGDPEKILIDLIGVAEAKSVLHGSGIRYEWPVSLTIKEFEASIECDHRTYAMTHAAMRIDKEHLNSAFGAID
jgi:hypothetical protein